MKLDIVTTNNEEISVKTGINVRILDKITESGYVIIRSDAIIPNAVVSDAIDIQLRELKKNEPTSDNEFFRMSIIAYEFHDLFTEVHKSLASLFRSIVYSNRFKDSKKVLFKDGFKTKDVIMGEGKLAMADLLTQLNMLCISLDWKFSELRELGKEHLKERQKDFKRDGWSEVKK